jgi:ABC-type transport system substrate-binding protein
MIMCSLKKVSVASAIAGVSLILAVLTLISAPLFAAHPLAILRASDEVRGLDSGELSEDARRTSRSNTSTNVSTQPQLDLFFPLTPGTWWLYRGSVTWSDQQTEKDAQADVTLKMTVEKVIQKPEFTVAAMPWLLIETKRHEVFFNSLPPDFDYAKLEKDAVTLDKFLSEDNLLFRWPLKPGMKFGDAESLRRDDVHYCWVVADQETKKLGDIKGLTPRSAEVSVLQFVTNPDDTEMELSPGIGILSYQYHHHGTVAETSLTLVEFHPAALLPVIPGPKP